MVRARARLSPFHLEASNRLPVTARHRSAVLSLFGALCLDGRYRRRVRALRREPWTGSAGPLAASYGNVDSPRLPLEDRVRRDRWASVSACGPSRVRLGPRICNPLVIRLARDCWAVGVEVQPVGRGPRGRSSSSGRARARSSGRRGSRGRSPRRVPSCVAVALRRLGLGADGLVGRAAVREVLLVGDDVRRVVEFQDGRARGGWRAGSGRAAAGPLSVPMVRCLDQGDGLVAVGDVQRLALPG